MSCLEQHFFECQPVVSLLALFFFEDGRWYVVLLKHDLWFNQQAVSLVMLSLDMQRVENRVFADDTTAPECSAFSGF